MTKQRSIARWILGICRGTHSYPQKEKRRMPFLFWLGLATVAAGLSIIY
ncbi:MAG: hypothetical protein IPN46_16980 [Saprospiraceae bacterium]|nr:hypothetical protein [Saprospiraceae bacterium]